MRTSEYRHRFGALAVSLTLAAGGTILHAQDTTQAGAAELSTQSFLALVPVRDTAEIRNAIEAAAQRETVAQNNRQLAEQWLAAAKLRVDDIERRIDAIKDRADIAKKQRREADRQRFEAERQAAERQKQLLERRRSLQEAEIELLRQKTEQAKLEREALELELQLLNKRVDPTRPASGTVERASFDQVVAQLERNVLNAQRAAADKSGDVANREKRVIERRISLLDAQQAIQSGGR